MSIYYTSVTLIYEHVAVQHQRCSSYNENAIDSTEQQRHKMAKTYDSLSDDMQQWIGQQHLFFVATAPLSADGHVNLSPKGYDCLRVLGANTVAYLDMTGSGNETSAHIMENGRITFMWCAFEGSPNILRAYGQGEVVVPETPRWDELITRFEPLLGARQIIVNHVTQVITTCGFAEQLLD
jgi:hypothetical protein